MDIKILKRMLVMFGSSPVLAQRNARIGFASFF